MGYHPGSREIEVQCGGPYSNMTSLMSYSTDREQQELCLVEQKNFEVSRAILANLINIFDLEPSTVNQFYKRLDNRGTPM